MADNSDVVLSLTDQTVLPTIKMVELDDSLTKMVAGGLNPQPLPPVHEYHFK